MSKPEYASYIALVEEQDINDELPKQHLLFGTFEIQSDLLNISLNDSIKLNMSKLKNEVLSYTEYKFINEIYLIKNVKILNEEDINRSNATILYPDVSMSTLKELHKKEFIKEISVISSQVFAHIMPYFYYIHELIPTGFYASFTSEYDDNDYSQRYEDIKWYFGSGESKKYQDSAKFRPFSDNYDQSVSTSEYMKDILSDHINMSEHDYLIGTTDIDFVYTPTEIAEFKRQASMLSEETLFSALCNDSDNEFTFDKSKTVKEWLKEYDIYLELDEDMTSLFQE